jgi:Chalcone isomerase-like
MFNTVRLWAQGCAQAGRGLCVVAALAVVSGAFGVVGLPDVGEAQAARLEGQQFDDTQQVADRTLRLNGLGLRGVAWVKAFVAGLYLPAPTRDAAQAMAMPGPKRLRMKIMLDAPAAELSKAVRRGVAKNENERAQAQLAERVTLFNQAIDSLGTLKVGDVVDLDWLPGKGAQLRHNERVVGPLVEGEDFYRSILKIYIGERPVDKRMKEGLLRGGS